MLNPKSRQMILELFASSLLEMIPNARFYEMKVKKLGFVCEVSTPFPLTRQYIQMIEERLKDHIKKSVEVRLFEMTPKNAVEFLRAKKQPGRAKKVKMDQPLVSMIQIGEYINYLNQEVDTDLSKIGAFYFDEVEGKENQITILGFCFADKNQMKEFKLKRKNAPDHIQMGIERGYFLIDQEQIVWLEPGLLYREKLTAELALFLKGKGLQRIHRPLSTDQPSEKEKFDILEKEGDPEGEFGLKDLFSHLFIRVFSENQTYLLQLREELSKISPFNGFSVTDPIGLNWEVFSLKKSELCIWVDRWLALMWEKSLLKNEFGIVE